MILHVCLMNSLIQCSEQSPTDLYSMCTVSFDINIQMQSYFVDQKYQFFKVSTIDKRF